MFSVKGFFSLHCTVMNSQAFRGSFLLHDAKCQEFHLLSTCPQGPSQQPPRWQAERHACHQVTTFGAERKYRGYPWMDTVGGSLQTTQSSPKPCKNWRFSNLSNWWPRFVCTKKKYSCPLNLKGAFKRPLCCKRKFIFEKNCNPMPPKQRSKLLWHSIILIGL